MMPTNPEWLTRHGGGLRAGADGHSCLVLFDGQPQYLVTAVPAAGQYNGQVVQTINGRRVPNPAIYPTAAAAVSGGLDELRKALGW
jgi:hypothetical protein